MSLEELLTLEEWKAFEKEIHQTTGLNAGIFNAEGTRITDYVAWANPLCPLIKGQPDSAQAVCSVAHQQIARQAQLTRQPAIAECDAGMLKICVPILKGDEFIGIAGGCGRLADSGRLESFYVAQVTGFPEEEVTALAGEIPFLKDKETLAAADFIATRVSEILRAAD